MMALSIEMKEALASGPNAVALACMDTRSGLVLGMEMRGNVQRDDIEVAAISAVQLCSAPCPEPTSNEVEEPCDESFIASSRWVHAYARVPKRRDLVVVGLAPGNANIALFRAWLREVAERVGPQAI